MSRPSGRPPRLARALLDRLLPPGDARSALGDLDEEYVRYVLPDRGRDRADGWYWRQVLRSAPGLIWSRVSAARGHGVAPALWNDIRFAARLLRRRPGFTVATVVTLGLGIGVNTTVFSVVHAILLRPLPYAHDVRLVRPLPDELFYLNSFEVPEVTERMTTFDAFSAWGRTFFLFSTGDETEEVRGARVSWSHFDVLGASPLLGRAFTRDDALRDGAVILAHGLWLRRFGGDPSVVGRTIEMYDQIVTVVGVMGPDHVPMEFDWEAWRPMPLDPAAMAGTGLSGIGRLREGVTIERAREELRVVLPTIWNEGGYVASPEEVAGLDIASVRLWLLGDARPTLLVLMSAVGMILLLACANVSNLFLAQGGQRAGEFALRSALGGSRLRIARQRFIEVGAMGVLGGVSALVLATVTLGWFRARLPAELPRAAQVSISADVLWFTLAATFFAVVLTGMIPVVDGARQRSRRLKSNRSTTSGRGRVRSLLVATEMALAVVLVVGAGLMIRTVVSLRSVDTGFDGDRVLTVRPSPPSDRYPAGPELDAYYAAVTDELSAIPGVSSVGGIQFLPMTPGGAWESYRPDGQVFAEGQNAPSTSVRVVLGDYFTAMRIALLEGRMFEPGDEALEAGAVTVVNESFAREAFPGTSALGRSVAMGEADVTIVGIVSDVKQDDVRSESHAEAYLPFGRRPWRRMHVVARVEGEPADFVTGAIGALRRVDPEIALLGPRPVGEVVSGTFGTASLITTLLALFGLVGLGLGAVGVYGVTAQTVSERRKEIGIRLALGADAGGVVRRTIVEGMRPVFAGLVVGLASAVAGASLLDSLVFGVATLDVTTFMLAPFVLVFTALLALGLPAVRAGHIDPVRTLAEQ